LRSDSRDAKTIEYLTTQLRRRIDPQAPRMEEPDMLLFGLIAGILGILIVSLLNLGATF